MVPYFRCSCLLGSLQDFEESVDLLVVYGHFFSWCGGDFLRVMFVKAQLKLGWIEGKYFERYKLENYNLL